MMIDEDDADKISEDAVDELLDTEDEEDELDFDLKDSIDEFGGGGDEDLKSRDWE
jgi:hypothetical protein